MKKLKRRKCDNVGLQLGLQLGMQLVCNWYATGLQLDACHAWLWPGPARPCSAPPRPALRGAGRGPRAAGHGPRPRAAGGDSRAADSGRQTVSGGQRTADRGRRTAGSGPRATDRGQRTAGSGPRAARAPDVNVDVNAARRQTDMGAPPKRAENFRNKGTIDSGASEKNAHLARSLYDTQEPPRPRCQC